MCHSLLALLKNPRSLLVSELHCVCENNKCAYFGYLDVDILQQFVIRKYIYFKADISKTEYLPCSK